MGIASSFLNKGDIEKELIKIKLWKLDNQNPIYPEYEEFKDKKDIGLALSGGGMRAAVLSIGWLQALNELGLISKLKYISSISGGSWTHAPLTYGTMDINTYLGHSIKPEDCTIAAIKDFTSMSNSHARLCKKAKFTQEFIGNFVENKLDLFNNIDFWSESVGECFFNMHGFNTNKSDEVLKKHISNYLNKKSVFPYPILNGSVLIGGERGFLPIEFTPYYYGVPVTYKEKDIHIKGFYTEPHAFTSTIADKKVYNSFKCGENLITLRKPSSVLSIQEQSGISSSAIAEMLGYKITDKLYERLNFPIIDCLLGNKMKLIDGGSTDFTGILSLLRRGCTSIIACIACNTSINGPGLLNSNETSYGALAALFGVHHSKESINSVTSEWINKQRHVFPSKYWNELIDSLKSKLKQGKPLTHKMKMRVIPNPLIHVIGGYEVVIIFTFSGECQDFMDKLPVDMKELMSKDKEEGRDGFLVQYGIKKASTALFPYLPVSVLSYSSMLIGLVSQSAAYSLLQHENDIKSLFN